MNHHPALHTERLAHLHHAHLMASADARRHRAMFERLRSAHASRAGVRAQGRRRRHRSAVGLAVAGLFTFVGESPADAGPAIADHDCDVPDTPSSERSFGRFLRAV